MAVVTQQVMAVRRLLLKDRKRRLLGINLQNIRVVCAMVKKEL